MNPTLISLAAFIGVTGLVAAIAMLLKSNDGGAIEDRLDVLAGKKAAPSQQNSVTKEALLQEGLKGLAGLASKIFERFDNLKLLFVQADSPMKAAREMSVGFMAELVKAECLDA